MGTIAEEITRISTAKSDLKTSINAKTDAQHQITTETIEDYADFVDSISTGSTPMFSGHYDTAGLTAIGWSAEEIAYYQENGVQWNASEDSYFVLSDEEKSITEANNKIRFLPKNITAPASFDEYNYLIAIPTINTSSISTFSYFFRKCFHLKAIPLIDTSRATRFEYMFGLCYSLKTIPLIDTSRGNYFGYMFSECCSLETIPLLNFSQAISFNYIFNKCYSLKTIPLISTGNVTSFAGAFYECWSLITIPLLDTAKATSFNKTFQNCYSLTTVPSIDVSKGVDINNMFSNCTSLKELGGLIDLGESYLTSSSAGYSNYTLRLSSSNKLTEQSLINVLTNLYDIATKGCRTQNCVLGATNLAKLTSAEGQQALADAQTKGWSIS